MEKGGLIHPGVYTGKRETQKARFTQQQQEDCYHEKMSEGGGWGMVVVTI
jgi:hypothetical protein